MDYILTGVLQHFPKMSHDGRIYTKECMQNAIREYEIKLKKAQRIIKLEKINKIYE